MIIDLGVEPSHSKMAERQAWLSLNSSLAPVTAVQSLHPSMHLWSSFGVRVPIRDE